MATYFHGAPEIQADGLQTLYLMNPGYGGYSADATASTNMVFLNSAATSLNPASISHQQQQQHFVGIPLQAQVAAQGQDPSRPMSIHDMPAAAGVHGLLPRLQYNIWSPNQVNSPGNLTSPLGLRRSSDLPSAQQGLSLSLSPQQPSYSLYRPDPEMQPPAPPGMSPTGEEAVRFSASTSLAGSGATSSGMPALQSVLTGSKYLKAAQQLLDEVVSVGKGVKDESPKAVKTSPTKAAKGAEEDGGEDANGKRAVAELTTAERQELQMKKAKLVNMLDEVEQRYRQYHHQMQIVISSFEAIAGIGAARTYTALALRTISKQFRCLRDAITGQIRATSKSLGEEDCLVGSKSEGGSRLRFVDHHLRQQRALQQLGMMQHNAWRPQRGLPERSVSVLRAWLFEHFLHPYPKDSDKHMLAKQTGLTRNQVSNWFINARVRLWKPMVEEMYLEETKEQQQQNNGEDKAGNSEAANDDDSTSKSSAPPPDDSPTRTEQSESFKTRQDYLQTDHQQSPAGATILSPSSTSIRIPPRFDHDRSNDDMIQFNLKRQRSDANDPASHHTSMTLPMTMEMMDLKPEDTSNSDLFMRFGDIMRAGEEQSFNLLTPGASNGGYAAYAMGDIGQFAPRYGSNAVSLTLGLPQGSYLSSDSIAMGRRLEMSTEANDYFSNNGNNSNHNPNPNPNPPVSHSPNAYDNLSMQSRKRFPAQLLPDFVA